MIPDKPADAADWDDAEVLYDDGEGGLAELVFDEDANDVVLRPRPDLTVDGSDGPPAA